MELNPRHLTLNNLFSGRLFRIPDYQRAYAWGTPQREDLFADIMEVHRMAGEHFMATVVSLARDKRRIGADEFQAVDVVDGQQRLTTLIILFKAIEKSLSADDPVEGKIKREMSELLVKGDHRSLVLLQTNHDSSNAFTAYLRRGEVLDGSGRTAAEQNLINAEKECEDFVARWKRGDSLVELVALLRNKISLVYHELVDESVVYRVFEVLNSRGLDVKWIDKLKSQLMALIFTHVKDDARAESLAEMQTLWQDIYRKLGLRIDLGDEALRFAGTWRLGDRPNRILNQEDAARTLFESAGTELKGICGIAEFLSEVVHAVYELDANVRLRAVTRIAHARFLAVAIVLRKFDAATSERLLGLWERVSFRVFGIYGADTRHKVGDYVRLAYDVMAARLDANAVAAAIRSIGEGYSIDDVLKNADWSESYDGWTEELRYLLYRYDEYLAREAGEQINTMQWEKIWVSDPSKSIEHIQPQSSGLRYINHLGNLTMLPPSINSSLRDKSPSEKSKTYRACGLKATILAGEAISAEGWSERMVKQRAAQIEAFIRKEWAD